MHRSPCRSDKLTAGSISQGVKRETIRVAELGEKQDYTQLQQALSARIFIEFQEDDEGYFPERRREKA